MPTYSVDEIVGNTLIADEPLTVFRDAQLTDIAARLQPGDTVGVVYSYLEREGIIWMISRNGQFMYVPHATGRFNQIPGALSQEEKAEAEAEKRARDNEDIVDKIWRGVKPLAFIAAGAFVASKIVPALIDEWSDLKAVKETKTA